MPSHSYSGWSVKKRAGITQWLEHRTRDWKVAGSNPAGAAGEFCSPGSTFCADSYFGIHSTHVTALAHKISRSFWQKCRWQVTAKDAYVALHEVTWLYGVHRTCAEMAAVSCGTSHASAVSTPLWWIFKKRAIKACHSCRTKGERSESAQESGE